MTSGNDVICSSFTSKYMHKNMYVLLDGVEINAKVILLKAIILSSDFDCPDYNNYILELLNFSDFTFALLMLKVFFKNNKLCFQLC